jgi:hypothetical protein
MEHHTSPDEHLLPRFVDKSRHCPTVIMGSLPRQRFILPYPKSRTAEDLDMGVVSTLPVVDLRQRFTYSAKQTDRRDATPASPDRVLLLAGAHRSLAAAMPCGLFSLAKLLRMLGW